MGSTKKRQGSANDDGSTREAIVAAAGKRLREAGLHGVGVDALLRAAGLTSGALYAQFRSKSQLFREVVVRGLADTRERLGALSGPNGGSLVDAIAAYLDQRHLEDVGGGCVLPSLAADVSRCDVGTRRAFEEGVTAVVDGMAALLPSGRGLSAKQLAWSQLALAVGAMTLARAVASPDVAKEILASCRAAVRHGTGAS